MLTTQNLEAMYTDERWLGFGYLGERRTALSMGEDPEGLTKEAAADLVAKADAMVLAHANRYSFTAEELFTWANSKDGRWYADCWFGNNGQHAFNYLPTDFAGL